jgi:hypothetical protein
MLARVRKCFHRFQKFLTKACSSLVTAESSATFSPYIPPEYAHALHSRRPHVRIRGERIYSVFYDGETRTLEVRYSDGDLRWYADVAGRAYEALLRSDRPDEALAREVFLRDRSAHST